MNRTNAGFTNLLMAGMLVVLMAIGGVVTMVVRTSERVEQAQGRMNTQQIQDKLAQYLIEKHATDELFEREEPLPDIMPDGILELPEQWASEERDFVEGEEYAPDTMAGYLPNNLDIPPALMRDANGQPFRICSYYYSRDNTNPTPDQIRRATGAQGLQTPQQVIDATVMAIISPRDGSNFSNLNCSLLTSSDNRSNVTNIKDTIRFITYGELIAAQLKKRLAMINTVPECDKPNEFLKIDWVPGELVPQWTCVTEAMPFATQDIPITCQDGDRVTLNDDGTINCVNITAINNVIGDTPSATSGTTADQRLVPLDGIAAPLCPMGQYTSQIGLVSELGNFSLVTSNTIRVGNQWQTTNTLVPSVPVSCQGFDPATGNPASSTRTLPLNIGNCDINNVAMAPEYDSHRASELVMFYLARSGELTCLALGRVEAPSMGYTNNMAPDLFDLFENKGIGFSSGLFFLSRGRVLTANSVRAGGSDNNAQFNICPAGKVAFYDPDNRDIICRDSVTYENYAAPVSNSSTPYCVNGSYVVFRNNRPTCVSATEVIAQITPAQSCTNTQIVGWNKLTHRFECMAR